MDAQDEGDAKTKFEEDVKPPFVSVFSYSTTVKVDADREFGHVDRVADLFPGLADELQHVDASGDLAVVRDFCARELVLVGAAVLLGKRDIDAECALVVWHDDDDPATPPVCVEFSFKYANEEEDYDCARPADMSAADCYGAQPTVSLRFAAIDLGDRVMLTWLRDIDGVDSTAKNAPFEQLLQSIHFQG